MNLYEKTEKEEIIYSGKLLRLKKIKVRLPNERFSTREIVEHPGAVAILAVDENKKVILVKQYRKAMEEVLWEVPAGKLDKNEEPLSCAKRELKEETGYRAESWRKIGSFYSSPGFSNEIIHIYFAQNLKEGAQKLDEDEFLEFYTFDIDKIKEMLRQGSIKDAKTQIALQYLFLEIAKDK